MQLHQLKLKRKPKHRKRVGRGGKKGTYSGKGVKGQKSRSGKQPRPGFAGGNDPFYKRFPKKRGSRGSKNIRVGVKMHRLRQKAVPVNLETLEKNFKEGERVSAKILLQKGLIDRIKGRIPKVKILGAGKLTKKLNFQAVELSKSAQEKTGYKPAKPKAIKIKTKKKKVVKKEIIKKAKAPKKTPKPKKKDKR